MLNRSRNISLCKLKLIKEHYAKSAYNILNSKTSDYEDIEHFIPISTIFKKCNSCNNIFF